ncbi:MAG TPA: aminopeptidase P N-terminal domain-containing protein, partial [Rectinemataceae bacterium]
MFSAQTYSRRREALVNQMKLRGYGSGFVLFLAHGESPVNYPANAYPFRQDSNWLYFFGLALPDMIALLDMDEGKAFLFCDEPGPDDLVWTGPRQPAPELAELCGASYGGGIGAAEARIAGIISAGAPIYSPPYCRAETRERLDALAGATLGKAQPLGGRLGQGAE